MTVAAKRFLTTIERSWNLASTAPIAPGPRVLRLVAAPTEYSDMRKALRWLEWSPDNRRPLVLFAEPFEDEPRWLRALVAKVADDCDAVRAGLTGNGITQTMTPASAAASAHTLARPDDTALDARTAVRYVGAIAKNLVNEALDGLFVAVIPKHVTDPKAYRAAMARIAAPPIDASLRLVVLDIPGAELGALLSGEARFELDRDALLAFLKQLGPRPTEGPAGPAPPSPALTAETAAPLPSQTTNQTLRALWLDAGQALSEGKAKLAAQFFQEAHGLCRENDLLAQECATGIGLGSAHLAAGDEPAALAAYACAMQRAAAADLPPLAAQAMLGTAGVLFGKARYAEARIAYETVARLATDMPTLVQEAEHMQHQCREREHLKTGDTKSHDRDRLEMEGAR